MISGPQKNKANQSQFQDPKNTPKEQKMIILSMVDPSMYAQCKISDQITCLDRHPVRVLSVPFDVAADGICQRNGHGLAGQMFFERSFEVVNLHSACIARIIHAPAGVNEPAVFVEYEKMRCPQRAIRLRNRLRLVIKIEPWEFALFHPCDHMLEIVFHIGIFTVGVDADEFHPLRGEFLGRPTSDLVGADDVGAMVAGEKYNQYLGIVEIGQFVCPAVCGGQFEIRRLFA